MTSNTTTVASGGTGTAPPRGRGTGSVLRVKNMSVLREVALLPVLIVLIIVGAVVSPAFLSVSNFAGIGQQSAALGVVVVGESLILMIGGMDLSLEGTYGLAPMIAAWLIVPVSAYGDGTNLSPYLGILILVVVGAVIGLINGLLIVKGRLNGFIVSSSSWSASSCAITAPAAPFTRWAATPRRPGRRASRSTGSRSASM